MGILSNFGIFLRFPLTKYGDVTAVTQDADFKIFLFLPILYLILGKVTQFLVKSSLLQKLSAKKPHGGGWKTPLPHQCL